MGIQMSKIPALVQEKITAFLSVEDMRTLMHVCKDIHDHIVSQRQFWVMSARHFYGKDPMLFARLRDPELFETHVLIEHICSAHTIFMETQENILENKYRDEVIEISNGSYGGIISMAVDDKAAIVAVFSNYRLRIYSLLRFGDPPIGFSRHNLVSSMVLHGNIVFIRPARRFRQHHTDVFNWKIGSSLTSLTPAAADAIGLDLKKSEQFLVAYNKAEHAALAYPLVENGYEVNPFSVPFEADMLLEDLCVCKNYILALFEKEKKLIFRQYLITSSEVAREFSDTHPISVGGPRFGFPYIFVTQTPNSAVSNGNEVRELWNNGPHTTYAASVRIPGPDITVGIEGGAIHGSVFSGPMIGGSFAFFIDTYGDETEVIYIGNHSDVIRQIRSLECDASWNIAPVGLSYVFTQESRIVLRRFFDVARADIVL